MNRHLSPSETELDLSNPLRMIDKKIVLFVAVQSIKFLCHSSTYESTNILTKDFLTLDINHIHNTFPFVLSPY